MGLFELNTVTHLSREQVVLITEHLNLVENKSELSYWLKGFLTAKNSELNKEDISLIVEQLKHQFLTKIDPMYPKHMQEKLNELHGQSALNC